MKSSNNKIGFTLIELLAVIAILAILLIIAIPSVIKLYNNAKDNTFVTETQSIINTATKQYMADQISSNTGDLYYCYDGTDNSKKLEMSGSDKLHYIMKGDKSKIKEILVCDGTRCIYKEEESGIDTGIINTTLIAQEGEIGYSEEYDELCPESEEVFETNSRYIFDLTYKGVRKVKVTVNTGIVDETQKEVAYGEDVEFTVTAAEGNHLEGAIFNGCGNATLNSTTGKLTITNVTEKLTCTVNLVKNEYTISYNTNGGSTAPESQTKVHGEDITLSSEAPTKEGYTFQGWSTSNTATSATYQASGTFSTNANTTLYAVWQPATYTVTYNNNSGSGCTSKSVTYNSTYGTLCTPTRSGYEFVGWYKESGLTNQVTSTTTVTQTADHTLYAKWKQSGVSLFNLLKDNALNTTINFSVNSGTSGTNGIYKTTSTDSGSTVYYYRGSVNNNLIFNNFCWKIIRTTETNGIKIIYNGTSDNGQCTTQTGTGTQIRTSYYNDGYTDNAYVGYMYGTSGSSTYNATHANTNDSTIKAEIDYWYGKNMTNVTDKLEDIVFCNDRSTKVYSSSTIGDSELSSYGTAGYSNEATIYGAAHRSSYYSKTPNPTLKCTNSNDKFTVNNSSGNKKLTYPAGLITLDELVFAGFNTYYSNTSNYKDTSNYLYNNQKYWTMTPVILDDEYIGRVGILNSKGYLDLDMTCFSKYGVRPVVSLKSGTLVTGSGSTTDPYVVE